MILITGGTGFFGKSLLRCSKVALGANGQKTLILSRTLEDFIKKNQKLLAGKEIQFHPADVLNPSQFPSGIEVEYILHAATESTIGNQLAPIDYYDQIVVGTRNLLEFAVNNRAKRFLYVSSGAVYGEMAEDKEYFEEDDLSAPNSLNPKNVYGVAKRTAEHLCSLYKEHYTLDVVIVRCFAFVGRDLPLNAHYAVGNFIRDALFEREITVKGDGTAVRSYMDQSDLASWLMTLLYHGKSGEAYNVGSDQAITIKDLAFLIRDLLAPEKEVKIESSNQQKSTRYVPSIEKAKSELGLEQTISLRDAIKNSISIH